MSGFIGGCAAIAGLTAYSDGDCNGGDCDGGADATAEGPAGDAMAAPTASPTAPAARDADATDGSLSQDVVAVDVTHDVGSNDALASCGTTCARAAARRTTTASAQNYYDCNPLYSASNPWTETAAFEACAALTGQAAKCTSGWKCGTALSICSSGVRRVRLLGVLRGELRPRERIRQLRLRVVHGSDLGLTYMVPRSPE